MSDQPNNGVPPIGVGPSQAELEVSALRASVPNAVRRLLTWFGPVTMTIGGMGIMLASLTVGDKPNIILGVVGGLIVMSAFETYADRASRKEGERWARLVASFINSDSRATIEVRHTYDSMQPELDERLAELVAKAIEAGTGETERLDPQGESAVPKGFAQ